MILPKLRLQAMMLTVAEMLAEMLGGSRFKLVKYMSPKNLGLIASTSCCVLSMGTPTLLPQRHPVVQSKSSRMLASGSMKDILHPKSKPQPCVRSFPLSLRVAYPHREGSATRESRSAPHFKSHCHFTAAARSLFRGLWRPFCKSRGRGAARLDAQVSLL